MYFQRETKSSSPLDIQYNTPLITYSCCIGSVNVRTPGRVELCLVLVWSLFIQDPVSKEETVMTYVEGNFNKRLQSRKHTETVVTGPGNDGEDEVHPSQSLQVRHIHSSIQSVSGFGNQWNYKMVLDMTTHIMLLMIAASVPCEQLLRLNFLLRSLCLWFFPATLLYNNASTVRKNYCNNGKMPRQF